MRNCVYCGRPLDHTVVASRDGLAHLNCLLERLSRASGQPPAPEIVEVIRMLIEIRRKLVALLEGECAGREFLEALKIDVEKHLVQLTKLLETLAGVT